MFKTHMKHLKMQDFTMNEIFFILFMCASYTF